MFPKSYRGNLNWASNPGVTIQWETGVPRDTLTARYRFVQTSRGLFVVHTYQAIRKVGRDIFALQMVVVR